MHAAAAQVALPRALNGPGRWFLLAGFLKVLLLAQLHTPSAASFALLGASCSAARGTCHAGELAYARSCRRHDGVPAQALLYPLDLWPCW